VSQLLPAARWDGRNGGERFNRRAPSLWSAAKAWDLEDQPIAAINARIHDNVAIEQLEERAENYFEHARTLFSQGAALEFRAGARNRQRRRLHA
jgi:hypothetical protein